MVVKKSSILGATLIVMGTCVGAGTLGLPVGTAPLGFLGMVSVMLIVWWFMCYTGLLVFEAASQFDLHASYFTMAQSIFGVWVGRVVFWAFIALLYTLLAAYFVAGSDLIKVFFHFISGHPQSGPWGLILWALLGMVALGWGMRSVDYINRLCMIGLLSAIAAMIVTLSFKISVPTLLSHAFHTHPLALPFVMSAFGYQVVVPSVRQYLQGHAKAVCFALIWGTLVPATIYLLWCSELFAILPTSGSHSLLKWAATPEPAYSLPLFVHHLLDHPWFSTITTAFVFFAIISSFLGILMSLFDLLKDGLTAYKPVKWQLMALALLPSFFYALCFHNGFMVVMRHASILVALLNGLLPIAMVYCLRKRAVHYTYRAPGGAWSLVFAALFFSIVLIIAIAA